jgi:hypothetical protein
MNYILFFDKYINALEHSFSTLITLLIQNYLDLNIVKLLSNGSNQLKNNANKKYRFISTNHCRHHLYSVIR